jgi:cytochrome c peroxidase
MDVTLSLAAKKGCRVFFNSMAALALTAGIAAAQAPTPVEPPKVPLPLNRVTVPDVNRLGLLDCTGPGLVNGACGGQYPGFPITKPNKQDELIALGKALFWDMQVGSDGVQACASCHFHAGADNRIINQKNPGLNRVAGTHLQIKNAINPSQLIANPDFTFTLGDPNTPLTTGHFPLAIVSSAAGAPNFGNNDVVSSQGVNAGTFTGLSGGRVENGNYAFTDPNGFNANGNTVRRVPPRNTPSAIGAVFNLRNFWDGRANLFFNGVNPFGMLDPSARVNTTTGPIQLMIPFSSLASQAVGPPRSDFEMSLTNRTFQDIAQKVLRPLPDTSTVPPTPGFIPLDRQAVSTTDSVLAPYTNGVGLNVSYIDLIKDVFQDKFWNDGTSTNDLMKSNFALFFGLAVQAYEATLIPDQTPVDTILARLGQVTQPNPTSADPVERGLAVFMSGRASCSFCHIGSETTSASVSHQTGFGNPAAPIVDGVRVPAVALAERMVMGDGSKAAYDTGFYNIGVRPTADDLSIFNRVNNVPFSFGMLAQEILRGTQAEVNTLLLSPNLNLPTSPTNLAPLPFNITVACAPGRRVLERGIVNGQGCRALNTNEHIAIRGSFKTPGLRNIKFTGPYFHNGSKKSIREVVDFYNLGGHFNLAFNPDNCKTNNKNCVIGQVDFDAEIAARGFSDLEISDLVEFMERGLTDNRVAKERAPFDHPQLCLPNGHNPDGSTGLVDLPAVGAEGHSRDILTFEETLAGASGPHDMKTGCQMSPPPNVN